MSNTSEQAIQQQIRQQQQFSFTLDDQTSESGQLMTEAEIQQEIKTAAENRIIKEDNKIVYKIPSLNDLDESYTEFCSCNKVYTALLFSIHPYFTKKFDYEDKKRMYYYDNWVNNNSLYVNLFFYMTVGLKFDHFFRSRAIWELTSVSSRQQGFLRLLLLPFSLSILIQTKIMEPQLKKVNHRILEKYNYDQELKDNPLYEKAYNDLLQYSRSIKQNQSENDSLKTEEQK